MLAFESNISDQPQAQCLLLARAMRFAGSSKSGRLRSPAAMVKLTAVQIWKYNGPDKDPFLLGSAADLSSFGFFQRGTVGEMLTFVGRTVARKTQVRPRPPRPDCPGLPQLGSCWPSGPCRVVCQCSLKVAPTAKASGELTPLGSVSLAVAGGPAADGAAGGVLLPRAEQGRPGGHRLCGCRLPRARRLLRGVKGAPQPSCQHRHNLHQA